METELEPLRPLELVPTGHTLHSRLPGETEKEPALQGVQPSNPDPSAVPKVPAGHSVHCDACDNPTVEPNDPMGHGRQDSAAVEREKEPRGQARQELRPSPPSVDEKVPAGHATHCLAVNPELRLRSCA